MVPRPVTGADSIVLRRIGPGPAPSANGRVLAADNHLAAAMLTLWQEAAIAGQDPVFGPDTERSQIAPEVADLLQRVRVGSASGVAATHGSDLVGAAVVTRRGLGTAARSGEIRALLTGSSTDAQLGDRLLVDVLASAAEQGWRDVLITVPEDSSAAAFYRQHEFSSVGRWPGADSSANLLLRRPMAAGDLGPGGRDELSYGHRLVELSHIIRDGMLTYPGIPAPRIGSHLSFDESAAIYAAGTEFAIATMLLAANTGTYLDTPAHRFRDGDDLSAVPLDRLADLPGVVVDVREHLTDGRRAIEQVTASAQDIAGHAVLVLTGHSRFWGSDSYFTDHPYLAQGFVDQLVDAGAALVGIDSLNIDSTHTGERPAHTALLAAGIPIVEHLTNLTELPQRGFRFTAAPPLIKGMGTFPVRAFAVVDPDSTDRAD